MTDNSQIDVIKVLQKHYETFIQNKNNMEKTFDELIDKNTNWTKATLGGYEKTISTKKCLKLLQQVRESTITEAVNHCVSQDWVKTIDNLKKMPIDRIYNFEDFVWDFTNHSPENKDRIIKFSRSLWNKKY